MDVNNHPLQTGPVGSATADNDSRVPHQVVVSTGTFHVENWRQYMPSGELEGSEGLVPATQALAGHGSLVDADNNMDSFAVDAMVGTVPAQQQALLRREAQAQAAAIQMRNLSAENVAKSKIDLDEAKSNLNQAQATLAAAGKLAEPPDPEVLVRLKDAVARTMLEVGKQTQKLQTDQASYDNDQKSVAQGHRNLTIRAAGGDPHHRWYHDRGAQIGMTAVAAGATLLVAYHMLSGVFESGDAQRLHRQIDQITTFLEEQRVFLQESMQSDASQNLTEPSPYTLDRQRVVDDNTGALRRAQETLSNLQTQGTLATGAIAIALTACICVVAATVIALVRESRQ